MNSNLNTNAERAAHILKQFEPDIEKGGEGSRGGQVIGHTKSGKPIYNHSNDESYKNFTATEHSDAAELHEARGHKAHRAWQDSREHWQDKGNQEESEKMHHHYDIGKYHREEAKKLDKIKKEKIATTSTGKPIYNKGGYHKDFTSEEHKEAAAKHHEVGQKK